MPEYSNVFALDAYDLALVKLVLGREKDLELLRGLLRLGIIEAERLRLHYRQTPLGEREAFAASRNLHKIDALPTVGANVYDILNHDMLAITLAGVEALKARLHGEVKAAEVEAEAGEAA